MRCKILFSSTLSNISLEDQINIFLSDRSKKMEDIKIASMDHTLYAFIFYTESAYFKNSKGDTDNV